MSGGLSIAVLGPIPRDRITTHNGETFEKYGCALYTVAALAALLDPDDRIHPIVHVRREDEDAIKELASWANHGPSAARVDHVDVRWRGYTGEFPEFAITE